jgi:hypothetical protein
VFWLLSRSRLEVGPVVETVLVLVHLFYLIY